MAGSGLAGPILRHRFPISKANHIKPSAPGAEHRKLQRAPSAGLPHPWPHGIVVKGSYTMGLAGMSLHCSLHPISTQQSSTPTSCTQEGHTHIRPSAGFTSTGWGLSLPHPTPPSVHGDVTYSYLPLVTHGPPEHEGSIPTVLQNPQPPSLLKDDIPHSMRESQLLSEHQLLSAGIKLEDEDHRNAFQERETGHHCNPRPMVAFHTTQPST